MEVTWWVCGGDLVDGCGGDLVGECGGDLVGGDDLVWWR